jgi:hypothetical protein
VVGLQDGRARVVAANIKLSLYSPDISSCIAMPAPAFLLPPLISPAAQPY